MIGRHRLVVPPGALTEYTVITGEQRVSNRVEVELSPHGLRFQRQPTLTLSYGHCIRPAGHRFGIVYLDEEGEMREWPRTYDDTGKAGLVGWISHFSRYVAAIPGYVAAGG